MYPPPPHSSSIPVTSLSNPKPPPPIFPRIFDEFGDIGTVSRLLKQNVFMIQYFSELQSKLGALIFGAGTIIFVLGLFLITSSRSYAQQNSEYGWKLAPYDTLRILAVFAEIDYSGTDVDGPHPKGTDQWRPTELPAYADSLFDVFSQSQPRGVITRYYREISMGHLTVLGDYFPRTVTVPYSVVRGKGLRGILDYVTREVEGADRLSSSDLRPEDFDFWLDNRGAGRQMTKSHGNFDGIDHLSIFLRNHLKLGNGSGRASGAGIGRIGGKTSNTYSVFGAGQSLPFGVFKHEVNHLFLGGNNFHAGGGNEARFLSYTFCVQGGWAMMGAANSSLQTCSAWDRYRLGWTGPGKKHLISALDPSGAEVYADLTAEGGGGTYVLRDFLTTGDAIRIALPFVPETEFPQWLWLENHTTTRGNGSPFDDFQYGDEDCIDNARPALYIQRQIDAEQKEGPHVFGSVHADYLKPLTANGAFDFRWEELNPDLPRCVNSTVYRPYILDPGRANPLTGNHQLEFPLVYNDSTQSITATNGRVPGLWKRDGEYVRLPFLGHPSYGFSERTQTRIGMGTNPSTASALTMLNNRRPRRDFRRNSKAVYLSGLSIELLDRRPDGSLVVDIRFDDHLIESTTRWAAPEIVLNDHRPQRPDLVVNGTLVLDRGETLTRFSNPDTVDGRVYFTDPTTLRVVSGAEISVYGVMELRKDSELRLDEGARLTVAKGAEIRVSDSSTLWVGPQVVVTGRGRIRLASGARVYCESRDAYRRMKKMARPRNRVLYIGKDDNGRD